MIPLELNKSSHAESIDRAFSRQSLTYDALDKENPILQDLRVQVYDHIQKFLDPTSHILELNAGTGIDALHLTSLGHHVHAIDVSEGMIAQIKKKISAFHLEGILSCQQLSYENLDHLSGENFDFVFSNFGGLNCIDDLQKVTRHLPGLMKPGGKISWVIMPPVCPAEILSIVNGNFTTAFRRFNRNGVVAHLEGEYFKTYYFSLSQIKNALGPRFRFLVSEGLAALSPQPHSLNFAKKYPGFYNVLRKFDATFRNHFPFNRWADHIIVTFEYIS